MVRVYLHALIFCCLSMNANGQLMFTNGGFEQYSSCPNGWDQTNKIIGCTSRYGTPDYYNCSYGASYANSGTGCVYLGAIRNGPTDTQEGINLLLTTPLVAGTSYSISLQVNYKVTVWSDPTFDYSIYYGCYGLRFAFANGNQTGRPTTYQYEYDGNSIAGNANNTYHTVSFTFTPTQSYTHLYIITAFRDNNTQANAVPDCISAGPVAYVYSHTIDDLEITPTVALPIELISFTPTVQETDVILNWSTASEQNNDYFQLERSRDGLVWEHLGNIDGHGSTQNQSDYVYVDHVAPRGILYYRLKQVDGDGVITVLSMRSVNMESSAEFKLYPNPATTEIVIEASEYYLQDFEISSINNKNLRLDYTILAETHSMKRVDISKLPSGVYLIRAGSVVRLLTKI